MKTDAALQRDVQDALNFEPTLKPAQIGVIVDDAVVTLTGTVDNYAKKLQAENAVRQVKGVKAVVEQIEVALSKSIEKSDSDLAHDIVKALRWNYSIQDENITVNVEHGQVALNGSVSWDYQRQIAAREVARIIGVKGIANNLILESAANDSVEKNAIDEAISRHWSLSANEIYVRAKDNTVTLTGEVDSLYQKDEAERIAWKTPGVRHVENKLEVAPRLTKLRP